MTPLSSLYADLSGYYDRFCLDVDYAAQADFASRNATGPRRIRAPRSRCGRAAGRWDSRA